MNIQEFFETNGEVAVAFSGGVDSAVLLMLAARYARRVKAYYVKTAFQPQFELDDALQVAGLLHAEMEILEADILSYPEVVANPGNRCYYCKKEIFSRICAAAARDGFSAVLDGTNASDDIADRPGFAALQEMQVLSPLRLCGYTKAQIRETARRSGLPVADKPSYACLATRIPTGTAITAGALAVTERAENELRQLGLRNFRVRYREGDALLELGRNDFDVFCRKKDAIYSTLSAIYRNVYLNLKERPDE